MIEFFRSVSPGVWVAWIGTIGAFLTLLRILAQMRLEATKAAAALQLKAADEAKEQRNNLERKLKEAEEANRRNVHDKLNAVNVQFLALQKEVEKYKAQELGHEREREALMENVKMTRNLMEAMERENKALRNSESNLRDRIGELERQVKTLERRLQDYEPGNK